MCEHHFECCPALKYQKHLSSHQVSQQHTAVAALQRQKLTPVLYSGMVLLCVCVYSTGRRRCPNCCCVPLVFYVMQNYRTKKQRRSLINVQVCTSTERVRALVSLSPLRCYLRAHTAASISSVYLQQQVSGLRSLAYLLPPAGGVPSFLSCCRLFVFLFVLCFSRREAPKQS